VPAVIRPISTSLTSACSRFTQSISLLTTVCFPERSLCLSRTRARLSLDDGSGIRVLGPDLGFRHAHGLPYLARRVIGSDLIVMGARHAFDESMKAKGMEIVRRRTGRVGRRTLLMELCDVLAQLQMTKPRGARTNRHSACMSAWTRRSPKRRPAARCLTLERLYCTSSEARHPPSARG
jgi:hypothetical protein